jgi:hypothetical protein
MNNVAKIVGVVLIGGLWIVALVDYLAKPQGLNEGVATVGQTAVDFYSTLEGKGAPLPIGGVSG